MKVIIEFETGSSQEIEVETVAELDRELARIPDGQEYILQDEFGDEVSLCELAGILRDEEEPFDAASFGADCPENWEEIVALLNRVYRETGRDPEEIWEDYCSGLIGEDDDGR